MLAALLAIGAGFNGASFLDFGGRDVSSLLMALLALGAVCCYLLALYLLPGGPGNGRNGRRDQKLATGSR